MELNKENYFEKFCEMIKNSWTYNKLTDFERKQWENVLKNGIVRNSLKGTVNQRWAILQGVYDSFLIGCGYNDNGNWRETDDVPQF